MGSVVLVADETVAARPDVVYGLFGARQGAGWVFAADCDVLAVACENLAVMAVDELNADSGLHGRRVRLLIADDATDPATGASQARWLIRAGCRVVLASVTSATFSAVQRAVGDSGVPLVHTVLNEGAVVRVMSSGGESARRASWRPLPLEPAR